MEDIIIYFLMCFGYREGNVDIVLQHSGRMESSNQTGWSLKGNKDTINLVVDSTYKILAMNCLQSKLNKFALQSINIYFETFHTYCSY